MASKYRLSFISSVRDSNVVGPIVLSILIGLVGGIAAIVLRYLINLVQHISFDHGQTVFSFMGDYYVIIIPAIGLFFVNLVVHAWAPEASGHGVPEVMYAVRKEKGKIRPRVAVVKTIASALCIGSGGSVGREGPIVQVGCSIGSTLGQIFQLEPERINLLIACGTAAAIGGAFNTPIAGFIFALEVILGKFEGRFLGFVVISSVVSTALVQSVEGGEPVFRLQQVFSMANPNELILYLLLGIFCGIVALTYVRTVYFFEDSFQSSKKNYLVKGIFAGLLVGVIGYIGIHYLGGNYLFGVGYGGINGILNIGNDTGLGIENNLHIPIVVALFALMFLKILATSFTLAGEGSGGVFAPALFIGATAGGIFGVVANHLFPGMVAPAGAYALVGMGAVFGASAHAPITAILILFEMTDDYKIILPLMLAVVISYIIAFTLFPDSIYSIKLRRRGGMAPDIPEVSILDITLVSDVMVDKVETITPNISVAALAKRFHNGHDRSFPVVDDQGALTGIVTEYDVETAIMTGNTDDLVAYDIMTSDVVTCTPDRKLRDILQEFASRNVHQIPVVDAEHPDKLLGVLRREEIFWAYGEMAGEQKRLMSRIGKSLPANYQDAIQIDVTVSEGHKDLCFQVLRNVKLPEGCLIGLLRRGDQVIVPRGDTKIEPGDILVFLTIPKYKNRLQVWVGQHD